MAPFTWPVTARFHHVDRVGIVFFARVYEYAHVCFEEALTEAFGRVGDPFVAGGFAMPLVHTEADHRKPIHHGDRLLVELSVEQRTARSLTLRYRIRGVDGSDDERAVVRMVHAFVKLPSFEPTTVRPEIEDALRRIGVLE